MKDILERLGESLLWLFGIVFFVIGPYFIGLFTMPHTKIKTDDVFIIWYVGIASVCMVSIILLFVYTYIYWVITGENILKS